VKELVNIGDMLDEFVTADKYNARGELVREGNVKDGDILTIVGEGRRDDSGRYGETLLIPVVVNDGSEELTYNMNKTSRRNVARAYGLETKAWIGKKLLLRVTQQQTPEGMASVIYTTPLEEEETGVKTASKRRKVV